MRIVRGTLCVCGRHHCGRHHTSKQSELRPPRRLLLGQLLLALLFARSIGLVADTLHDAQRPPARGPPGHVCLDLARERGRLLLLLLGEIDSGLFLGRDHLDCVGGQDEE